MIENGSHGYYAANVVKDIVEEYFKLEAEIEEDRIAMPYTEQQN